ncbi:M12 family metallopeptidase [Aureibaculum sp. 2210JD6-5]|uniref:M12 family metallopeptidase n=1 Tax=Aureibaculum sp. 2210JD6-5 TaxID=3103957 RepID=UPI002AAC687E|nr:M12 family metallopeptidase [Aureibaculum sp. 2210JD6-5]MDY7394058.1 M12 family metallopeptidase [Aureibaculum sp. 2210JD6-5]
MKNFKLLFIFSLLIIYNCKSDKKNINNITNEKEIVNENKKGIEGLCTQITSNSPKDYYLFSSITNEIRDTMGLIFNESSEVENFKNWKNDIVQYKIASHKFDSISQSFSKEFIEQLNEKSFGIESAIIFEEIWDNNNITVRFMDGDATNQNRVKQYAKEWEKWSAVKFNFINNGKSDITITFNSSGYWSVIGKSSRDTIPSMSLTSIQKETFEDYRGIVLHEFGHALGLIHEHSSPNSPLEWDIPFVEKYYLDNHGWSKEKTYWNVIHRYNFGQYNHLDATKFDPKSIMIYEIPSSFLKNSNQSFNTNNNLSNLDKELIGKKYK